MKIERGKFEVGAPQTGLKLLWLRFYLCRSPFQGGTPSLFSLYVVIVVFTNVLIHRYVIAPVCCSCTRMCCGVMYCYIPLLHILMYFPLYNCTQRILHTCTSSFLPRSFSGANYPAGRSHSLSANWGGGGVPGEDISTSNVLDAEHCRF